MIDLNFDELVSGITAAGWMPENEAAVEKLRDFWRQQRPYDAKSIRVLSDQEALNSTPWLAAETLASTYDKPVEFIRRGLEACRLAEVHQSYFIDRYLRGDKDVPKNDAVEHHSRILQGIIPC